MLARGFEEVQRARGIYFEIEKGNVASLVVRRLCCAVDNEIELVLLEEIEHSFAITDVQVNRCEVVRDTLQSLEIPNGVPPGTEEHAPHVVVHANYAVPLAIEMLDGFRSN